MDLSEKRLSLQMLDVMATRIHVGLHAQLGMEVDVMQMRTNSAYARRLLWLCDAAEGTELPYLADLYRHYARVLPGFFSRLMSDENHSQTSSDWPDSLNTEQRPPIRQES